MGLLLVLAAGANPASAITRASTSTVVNATATSTVIVAAPSQTQSGDVLVACLALNGGSVTALGVPFGWSPIASVTAISNPHVFGYYKVAGTLEPPSYTWTLTSAVANGAGIARYLGVDTTSPLDTTVATATGAAATSGTVPGVTTATANAMLAGCMAINSSSASIVMNPPAGMTPAWNLDGKRHQYADGPQASAGASGSKTWTFSASREWAGWLTALRPQAGAPVNTAPPVVSGSAVVGSVLTATTGTWSSGTPVTYAYQWQTNTVAFGGTWVNATGSGATSSAYTVAAADAGLYLRVAVTATNALSSAVASSSATAMVAPFNSVAPSVCAAPAVGVACAATNGTWAGASSFVYQWQTNTVSSGGTWVGATGSQFF